MHLRIKNYKIATEVGNNGGGMNQEFKRNKIVAAFLAWFFGNWGLHRFYMGKWDGILYLIFSMTYIPLIISIIQGIQYMIITDEAFQKKCNYNSAIAKMMNVKTQSIAKVRTTQNVQRTQYVNTEDSHRADNGHAHILVTQENKKLANEINKAQDRLERMKSNDFAFDKNNIKIDKKKEREQLKELKEHGLVSEEEYRERMRML